MQILGPHPGLGQQPPCVPQPSRTIWLQLEAEDPCVSHGRREESAAASLSFPWPVIWFHFCQCRSGEVSPTAYKRDAKKDGMSLLVRTAKAQR